MNDIYKLFNYTQKFDELIKEFQNINWEDIDEKTAENFIKSMSFIFDVSKKVDPISYTVFYSMQYTFWQIVVIGEMLKDKKLSARLLSNSLTLFGKEPEDLIIQDSITDNLLKKSVVFRNTIKELTEKYGSETGVFNLKDYEKDGVLLKFEGGDLLYSLHKATMFVKAIKNAKLYYYINRVFNQHVDYNKDLNLDTRNYISREIYDVRGGPQGDGTDYYVYKFPEEKGKEIIETLEQRSEWSKDRLDDNILDDFEYNEEVLSIENGYYHYELVCRTNDENKKKNITKENATGHEIGVYDVDKNILYYYWESI